MSKITKIIISTSVALTAFSAQAEDLLYPQTVASRSVSSQPAPLGNQPSQYIFQGEFLVDNPAYVKTAGRPRDQVRQEARKARDVHAGEFRG